MPKVDVQKKVNELLKKVDLVVQKQKEVLNNEKVILKTVSIDIEEDETIEQEVKKSETSKFQQMFLTKVKKHEFLFPLIIAIGVILVWRGLWNIFDQIPILSYSIVSLILGLLILWFFNRIRSL